MTLAALDRLVVAGKLKQEPASADEIAALIRSGETWLKDAANRMRVPMSPSAMCVAFMYAAGCCSHTCPRCDRANTTN
jgi:hypothetical protein